MKRLSGTRRKAAALGILVAASGLSWAHAHPEDDICGFDSGIDPLLCQSLSEIDRGGSLSGLDALAAGAGEMGLFGAFLAFFNEGWTHVMLGGVDHMLFIAALFLSTQRIGSMVAQVSAFTLAHTVTVGLSALGVIAPPSSVVEPLIAASIAFVAVEAIVFRQPPPWRLGLVFLFGLVHGMGFARAFSAATADGSVFWPGLAGFNLGVEAAQLVVGALVLAIAWSVRYVAFAGTYSNQFRNWFTVPASLTIGFAGLVWTAQALGLA